LAFRADAAIVKLSLPELVAQSDVIVRGMVTKTECRWGSEAPNPSRRLIFTDVLLTPNDWLKGTADSGPVLITIQGGVIGDLGLRVEDEPEFKVGEEVIVFLSPMADNGRRTVTNFCEGKYTIASEGIQETGEAPGEFVSNVMRAVEDWEGRGR
jgi:hypothetical protein